MAREIMVPRVKIIAIPKGAPFSDLETILRRSPHTRYPVYERDLDHIIGMIHIKDLLRGFLHQTPRSIELVRPVSHVPESMPIDTVLSLMRQLRTQMVVMDEHGGNAGLPVEDPFEEVIGDIMMGWGASQDPSRFKW
jgi:CBS domain containing-hemolysin-like protein